MVSRRSILTTLLFLVLFPSIAIGQALQLLPGLSSVVISEATGTVASTTFSPSDQKLLNRLAGPLTATNSDLSTQANEFYDFFYSDATGAPLANGSCLSIEATFDKPNQAGFNITQVDLLFGNTSQAPRFFNRVGSLVVGNNYLLASENQAIDGQASTFSALGNTSGKPAGFRMRLTLCFCDPPCCVLAGGCCFGNICLDGVLEADCRARAAQFLGPERACDEGACRLDAQCALFSKAACTARGGIHQGAGTRCP